MKLKSGCLGAETTNTGQRLWGHLRERYRKKLSGYLELAPDEAFLQLVWAANLIQAGHPEAGSPYLDNVHPDAVTSDLSNRRHMHKWELETTINELLVVPKRNKPLRNQWRELDCRNYNALANILNQLRRLENAESGLRLQHMSVFAEMPRISARQFDWQRGWFNVRQFYRSTYIYGQGTAASYFEATHGLTVNEYSLIGFALYTHFCNHPVASRNMDFRPLPINPQAYQAALNLLALPIGDARTRARDLRRRHWPVAYQPSILRTYPCLSFGDRQERIVSPLPQLILERVTSGIFYDVAAADGNVRHEYGRRFEKYALRYLQAMLPGIAWQEEQSYNWRRAEIKSPDILWLLGPDVRLAIECKATRMSIDARYADDPLTVRGYDDIVKAVFQLWRYFSHCRRGLTGHGLHELATGIVLTLDSWLLLADRLIDDVIAKAVAMAAVNDPDILPEDRRPVLFCAMTDLENTLATASEATFEAAVGRAVAERRQGWLLSSSHDDVRPEGAVRRQYPFRGEMAEVLPWWDWLEEQRDN